MPNRNTDGGYRYAYQGQEKDNETGMEAFELRLWDARIGRWLTTDSKREFYSPYLGMGNNPTSTIDPDGGSTSKCPPACDDLPMGATPLIGEGGFVSDNLYGGTLDEIVITGYNPVNLKGGSHKQILDGLIGNIIKFGKIRNENIFLGEAKNEYPNITDFVDNNLNIAELSGWKTIERTLEIEGSDVNVTAQFPNARTKPKKPEPEIISFSARARKRGTVHSKRYAFEIYLIAKSINKSGHERSAISPEPLLISTFDEKLFDKIKFRIMNGIKN